MIVSQIMTVYISHALGSADNGNSSMSTVKYFGSHTQVFNQSPFKVAGRIFTTPLPRSSQSPKTPFYLSWAIHSSFVLLNFRDLASLLSFVTLGQSFSQILDLPRAWWMKRWKPVGSFSSRLPKQILAYSSPAHPQLRCQSFSLLFCPREGL